MNTRLKGTTVIRAYTQFRARQDSTVAAMLDGILQVPAYATWGRNHHDALKDNLHRAMSMVIDGATTGESVTAEDLEFFKEIGRQRGEQRFPLNDMRAGFHLSYLAGLRELFGLAQTANHAELTELTTYAAREHPRMLEVAEAAFLSAYRDLGDANLARLRLLERLVEGRDAEAFAREADMELSPAYLVQVFRLPRHTETGVGQRSDRSRQCLDEFPTVLWRHDTRARELLCLVPAEKPDGGTRVASRLASSLAETANRKLVSTQALATNIGSIPHAYHEAQQTLTLAAAMPDIRTEPYRVDELLVELAIARHPELRERLEALLEPLAAGTELRSTLEALFAHRLDRGSTARSLYIHRRTLTYRIRRIHELTGIDPATPHGIQLLRTALTAAQLSGY